MSDLPDFKQRSEHGSARVDGKL